MLLSAAALNAGCAAQRLIQPGAAGLPPSQVAILVTAQPPKSGTPGALQRVTDSRGKNVISYSLLDLDTRNSAVVLPGRDEIGLSCVVGAQMLEPSATFELRGGYTYTLDCNRAGGFQVGVTAVETPTAGADQPR